MSTALGIVHLACAGLYLWMAWAWPEGRARRLIVAPLLVVLGVDWLLR